MHNLEKVAREVLANWTSNTLADSVRKLQTIIDELDAARASCANEISTAREQSNDGLEIDDEPYVAVCDNGTWIGSWIWVGKSEESKVIITPGLQWLVLPDEDTARYTNWGDDRAGDASALVVKVNADPMLGTGHTDWRMPTNDELQSLVSTEADPKQGWFWSSSPVANNAGFAWYCHFGHGFVSIGNRRNDLRVRLVRASQ